MFRLPIARHVIRRADLRVFCLLIIGAGTAAADRFSASVAVDTSRALGRISSEIYGQYLEHVQVEEECIYPSIWDDKSRFADAIGLRKDVIAAAKDLSVPIIRWPGGCFADVYHWENGIGPRKLRPTLTNGHYKASKETHQFGTDEFLNWSEQLGSKRYINVNLGSGTLDEALRWLEYCNGGPETPQGKRRAANGRKEPYGVTHWGIGNETWGSWEVGHSDAPTYARNLATWAPEMKKQDPSIKILGVGSSEGADPKWDREVLQQAGEAIDYLTLHVYAHSTENAANEYDAVVFTPSYFDFRFRNMIQTLDAYKAATGSTRDIRVSVDEWNIRHYDGKKLLRREPRHMQDALFVSGVLNVMLRHSPRIGMANYVFLVNGHAPLLVNADQVVKTPLYHVFQQYGRWMKGTALAVDSRGPVRVPPDPLMGSHGMTVSKNYQPGEVPLLDSTAALQDDGTLVLALVNRHRSDTAEVALLLPDGYAVRTAWTLRSGSPTDANTFDQPNLIAPVETKVDQPAATWNCAPASITLLACKRVN
jgi:alpha-N-arabinofuranosidase